MNVRIKKEIFNEAYFPLLQDYTHRYEVYYGGAGSGKSVFIAQKLILKALKGQRKILVVRKYGTTLRDSVFQLILDTLSRWKLLPLASVNKTNFTIELVNGSSFLFKGIDDPEKIKSIVDITDIWVEECTELASEEIDQLDLRLRAKAADLQMVFSFNPVSKVNWTYKRWFCGDVPPDTIITKTTYKDNRFLPQAYIDSLEGMMRTNPTYFKIYALGDFCSLDRLVFTNWSKEHFDGIPQGELCVGLDFGFVSDPTALIACTVQGNDLYIFREWGAQGKTNTEIAAAIKALGFSKSVIIADSAEQKSIEEIRREGITRIRPAAKGQDSIINGIKKLWEYNIHVSDQCPQVITELENYAWQKDRSTGEYIDKPIDTFNHFLDALRYSMQCHKAQVKLMSKAGFGL